MAPVLMGRLDAVVLTGGLARSERITDGLTARIGFLGDVVLVPGEDELEALAHGCLRVLRGEEEPRCYPEKVDGATIEL